MSSVNLGNNLVNIGSASLVTVVLIRLFGENGMGIAVGVAVLGIAVCAISTGIMAFAFTEELRKRRNQSNNTCPHCGKDISNNKGMN